MPEIFKNEWGRLVNIDGRQVTTELSILMATAMALGKPRRSFFIILNYLHFSKAPTPLILTKRYTAIYQVALCGLAHRSPSTSPPSGVSKVRPGPLHQECRFTRQWASSSRASGPSLYSTLPSPRAQSPAAAHHPLAAGSSQGIHIALHRHSTRTRLARPLRAAYPQCFAPIPNTLKMKSSARRASPGRLCVRVCP